MGTVMEELPRDMNLATLAQRCRQEIEKHQRREASDDRYCLEIFRRAMSQRDYEAWDVLQRNFTALVKGWMHRHPYRETAYRLDSEENYVARAFARLWRASIRNPELGFQSLGAALRLLNASLNGAIID